MLGLARFITSFFHPLTLITPSVFLIVLLSGQTYRSAFYWAGISLIFVIAVIFYIRLGMKKGIFSNFDVSERRQRIFLFPFIMLEGVIFISLLFIFKGPLSLLNAMVYFTAAVIILTFVNQKIKVSVHVGGLTAVIVTGIYFFGPLFYPALLLVPIMAWARVVEKRHSIRETIAGAIAGSLLAFIGIIVVQYLL